MFLMMMQSVSNYQNGVLSHQKEQFWNQHIRVSCTKGSGARDQDNNSYTFAVGYVLF